MTRIDIESTSSLNLVKLSEDLEALGEDARSLLQGLSDQELVYSRRTTSNYETELIQVAASAIAALVDHRKRSSSQSLDHITDRVIGEILIERDRQDEKFGQMPRGLDPLVWVAVILEELAEVSEEVYG